MRSGDVLASVRADGAVWADFAGPLMKCLKVVELMDYAPGMEFVRA